MDTTKLLVPMCMEALVVTDPPDPRRQPFVDLSPDFSLFGRELPLGRNFAPRLFEGRQDLLPVGVHLHWALPTALTHGVQRYGESLQFYPVPNRWCVIRMATTTAQADKRIRAWIVESDYLDARARPRNWLQKDQTDTFRAFRLGKSFDYADWAEEKSDQRCWLTAVGYGHPALAAFYPAGRNVFGFHDALSDVPDPRAASTLTYLVTGWYAHAADDPLNPADPLQRLQELRSQWSVTAPNYPTSTLCHSAIYGVQWEGQGKPYRSGIPEGKINLAVGHTATEAFSALMRAGSDTASLVEPLLCAFQYDMLSDPHTVPGIAEIDAEVHRRGFSPEAGGTVWTMQRTENQQPLASSTDTRLAPFPDAEFYMARGMQREAAARQVSLVATTFTRLQEAQQQYDACQRDLASLQWEYYAAWFKSQLDVKPAGINDALRAEMARLQEAMRTTRDALHQASTTLAERRQACSALDGFSGENPTYAVRARDMPRFWRANDPSILLAGVQAPQPAAAGDKAAALLCRVPSQVLTEITFQWQNNLLQPAPGGTVRVPATALFDFLPAKAGVPNLPYEEIRALFYETLLLDPGMAELIARQAYQRAGRDGVGSQLIQYLAQAIQHTLAAPRGPSSQAAFAGTIPADFAVRPHAPAWSPLFILWEAEWCPTAVEPQHWARHWAFRNNTDYQYTGTVPVEAQTERQRFMVRGWAPLSPSIAQHLQERLQKTVERSPDAPEGLRALLAQFGTWQLLTQSLSGLSNALIMREETLQLPPLQVNTLRIDTNVYKEIGGSMDCSPMEGDVRGQDDPSRFCPIRAGHLKIGRLWLVDTFGQGQKVVDDAAQIRAALTIAESLTGAQPAPAAWIPLPPRIMQPARLLWRCMSVADEYNHTLRETTSNPATSPLCGWIVPNHFDKSLLAFDASGRLQGQLRIIPNTPRPIWLDKPWATLDPHTTPQVSDRHLQAFLTNLQDSGALALTVLLELIDQCSLCLTSAEAQQVQSLSVLVGQPLALVRAALTLELLGRPATDQSWVQSAAPNARGFPAAQFPVWLGDLRKGKDGLIGYFVEQDYKQMRLPFGATVAAPAMQPYFALNSPVALSLADGSVSVTLLMDPRAGVHASSGILPAQFLELPPYEIADALERMDLTFTVAPYIGDPERLRLPIPEDTLGQWSWSHAHAPGGWQSQTEIGKRDSVPGVPTTPVQIYEGWLTVQRGLGRTNN